jgi:hypothetical protein
MISGLDANFGDIRAKRIPLSSIRKLAVPIAECGVMKAEFKTFEKMELSVRNAPAPPSVY